ncbi:MAG TPA: hypothetical protein PLQ00_10810 [Thermoguttaceae bacterium]|nr:hypothetical protein [Thermoguttaceae bacterium]
MQAVQKIFSIGWLAGCLAIGAAGCEQPGSGPARSNPSGSPAPAARRRPLPSTDRPDSLPTAQGEKASSGEATGPGGAKVPGENPPTVVREKAVVGVSPKGQGYGGGLITEPISVYFKAPQMVVFRIQIPHAMNLYRGVHGHFPKTHQEFMEKIIQENGIQLPPLPPGARYVYDPQKAAQMPQYDPADPPLLVERPAP